MANVTAALEPTLDGAIARLSALTAQAFADIGAALPALDFEYASAVAAGLTERATVLAALGAQWIISDFGTFAELAKWASRVRGDIAYERLEDHAALIYCAGAIALHQVGAEQTLPDASACLDRYRQRLLAGRAGLDRNLVVATAEHPASWMTNTGQAAAFDELAGIIDTLLEDAALDARIRARWLLWLGANQMHADQRQAAERTWSRAQASAEAARWPWLRFHLARMAVRPLIEDGHLEQAQQQLDALKSQLDYDRPLDLADYHHLRGWIALANGDPRVGRQHYELAIEAARRGALPANMLSVYEGGLAQGLLGEGREDEAERVMRAMALLSGPRGDAVRAANIALARACHARRTRAADYAGSLAEGLRHAREQGLLRFFRLSPKLAADLCADALEAGIEAEFVRRAIGARSLKPPPEATTTDTWPWPIKVYALRAFSVSVGGVTLKFEARAQMKPLALLKLLVCVEGGPIAVSRVTDALWPDLDPAPARGVFDVNVGRLRQLLTLPAAVDVSQGRIGLNPAVVWVDTRALAELARSALAPEIIGRRALALYRTPLLVHDDEESWMLAPRAHAAGWFAGAIERAVRGLAARGLRAEARTLAEQALAVEASERLARLVREIMN